METSLDYEFLKPMVRRWHEKIQLAIEGKQRFQNIAEQCMQFYAGPVGEIWEGKYTSKFLKGALEPKFKLSINKAFEVVAMIGPALYAQNPVRNVRPYQPIEFGPEVFGDANDPQVQQIYEQATAQQEQYVGVRKLACNLMESYLSYTPREQPGGLKQAAEDAITECLIKGAGLLFPRHYTMPGSDRTLTGCFYESIDNFVVDPDATRWDFGEARWIALRHIQPRWEVEKKFRLKKDALKYKAKMESNEAQATRRTHPTGNYQKETGETKDLIVWWEIWSIAGVGTRFATEMPKKLEKAFDDVVGDYAHICICDNVDWPLNAPTEEMRDATDDDVKEMFRWPIPFWLDRRWPCAMLSFYNEPGTPWPVATLRPGLGELTLLNLLLSFLTEAIWNRSKTLIVTLDRFKKIVESALKSGGNLEVIGLKDLDKADLDKLVNWLQAPEVNQDIFVIIEKIFELFDKRTGMTDLLYAMGTQSRSATDAQTKASKVDVRPNHMKDEVTEWMSEAARMEKLVAFWSGVNGDDVKPLLGEVGAHLWDQHIVQADPEVVHREMECTVEHHSAAAPNKARDVANMEQIYPAVAQEFSKHADTTGDTTAINALNDKMFDALDQDPSGLQMGDRMPPPPPPPPPDPKLEMEIQKMQLEIQALQMKIQGEQQKAQMDLAVTQQKAELDGQKSQLDAAASMQKAELEAAAQAQKAEVEASGNQTKLLMDAIAHRQELEQDEERHDQEMRQDAEVHRQKIRMETTKQRLLRLNQPKGVNKPGKNGNGKPKAAASK